MTGLIYFIGGMLFLSFIIPISDGLLSLILTWLEKMKARQAEIINSINLKIKRDALSSPDDSNDIRIVGFASEIQEQEEEDDNDL